MSVRRHPLLWSLGVWSALFVVPVGLAATNDLSFSIEAVDKVTKTTWPTVWTLLTVSHARVIFSYAPHVKTYLGQESPSYGFPADGLPTTEASCTDFVRETTVGSEHVLKFKFANHGDVYEHGTFAISVKQKGMNSRALLQQVKDACGTQQIEEDHRAQIEREEAERKRKEADAAWQADVEAKRRLYEEETRQIAQQREEARLAFAKSILAALRFADEPDPFASVRGEFDLSASDSRQWKTSLQLAGADKCALLKTPPANPPSPSAWTFGCVFHASSDGYEGTVKSVGSILNLPFQPDEKAVGINQVFFADPSKPARRVFVAKINEATTRIAVVALPSSAAPVEFDKALLPEPPEVPPTEATVHDEVEAIRSGTHAAMPPAQRSTESIPAVSVRTTMNIKNSTAYELSVFFDGPVSQKLTLAPGASQDLDLAPGTFRVAGRVAAANVLPFYGEETYAGSARYSVTFYIGQ